MNLTAVLFFSFLFFSFSFFLSFFFCIEQKIIPLIISRSIFCGTKFSHGIPQHIASITLMPAQVRKQMKEPQLSGKNR
jgi:hypothetical protein